MGDRSKIVIEDRGERVYLYGHWMGSKSIGHAVHGLESGRTADGSFLARIVFCSMIGPNTRGDTGFGISASIQDGQYPVPDSVLADWVKDTGWPQLPTSYRGQREADPS